MFSLCAVVFFLYFILHLPYFICCLGVGLKCINVLNGGGLIIVFLYSKLCIIFPHSCLGFLWQRKGYKTSGGNRNLVLY